MLRELKVAEVYITIDGTLHIYADQRNPVMRVMPDEGGDYFVDEEGLLSGEEIFILQASYSRRKYKYQFGNA